MSVGFIGLGTQSRRRRSRAGAITGTAPTLSQTITGNDLSDHVTWGSATAPDGETLTGASPVREMNINGAGWVAYAGATVLVDLETAQVRETWAVVGDTVPAKIFNSVERTNVYTAPVASGALSDQAFEQNNGVQTYNVSGDFTGSGLVYSVNSVTGVTINSGTGVVSFDTDVMALQSATSIVVTATNSGGFATSGFSTDIVELLTFSVANTEVGLELDFGSSPDSTPFTFEIESGYGAAVYTTDINGTSLTVGLVKAGPTYILKPAQSGPATEDSEQTGIPGYYLTDNVSLGDPTFLWLIDAVSTGDTDLAYTPTVAASTPGLVLRETVGAVTVDSDPVVIGAADVTAPTLSSATDAANGATASTGSVSTDEGNGTLYWVVTTSATAPTAAQVKLGQDNSSVAAADSGSQAVSGTGVQTITPAPSGLTETTAYTTHFMHEDAATNQSTVASASGFTTASASVPWTPASDAASFKLWLDPSDAAERTITGGFVTALSDKLNKVGDFNVSSVISPASPLTTLNGLDVVDLSDEDWYTGDADLVSGDSFFILAALDTVEDSPRMITNAAGNASMPSASVGSGNTVLAFYDGNVGGTIAVRFNTVAFAGTTRDQLYTAMVDDTQKIIEVELQGSVTNLRISSATLGQRSIMVHADVIVTDGAPSTTIRQKVEGYLAHKYGQTALLPGAHPYKTDAPTE